MRLPRVLHTLISLWKLDESALQLAATKVSGLFLFCVTLSALPYERHQKVIVCTVLFLDGMPMPFGSVNWPVVMNSTWEYIRRTVPYQRLVGVGGFRGRAKCKHYDVSMQEPRFAKIE